MPVMVATTIETIAGQTRMVYHNTCVASFDPVKKCLTLNSGGFMTKTTKKRINQFFDMFGLPFSLYQKKGEWYVTRTDGEKPINYGFEYFFA